MDNQGVVLSAVLMLIHSRPLVSTGTSPFHQQNRIVTVIAHVVSCYHLQIAYAILINSLFIICVCDLPLYRMDIRLEAGQSLRVLARILAGPKM